MKVSTTSTSIESAADILIERKVASRIAARDRTLFAFENDPSAVRIARYSMGWTSLASDPPTPLSRIHDLVEEVRALDVDDVVLIGQGGSSQAAMALNNLAGSDRAFRFQAIDFVSPLRLAKRLEKLDPARAFFIVSSKSGTTVETLSMYRLLRRMVDDLIGREAAGGRFMAITEPGTPLARIAVDEGFHTVAYGPTTVGGRFSALSVVGLIPAALAGVDIDEIVSRAARAEAACSADAPENPAIQLAAFLYRNHLEGRDKFSFVTPQPSRVLGLWVEQLIAESLGKHGVGILPQIEVDWTLLEQEHMDRSAIVVFPEGDHEAAQAATRISRALPTFSMELDGYLDLGAAFTVWEYATTMVAHLLGVEPFDQPDVSAAKRATEFVLSGTLLPTPALTLPDGTEVDFSKATCRRCTLGDEPADLAEAIGILIGSIVDGDYFALLSYVPFLAGRREPLERIRRAVAAGIGTVSCLEIGPRYLHSTGQLHKGGPGTGVFLILSGDEAVDFAVPESSFTLQQLKIAQARGDFAALSARERRVLHVHLPDIEPETIDAVADLVEAAVAQRAQAQLTD